MDDRQLLQEYAQNGTEGAFAEIVSRHFDMVYSAALRQVQDPHLAEDISQGVFLALAQQAKSIRKDAIISGWLFIGTRYAAAKALRARRRKMHYEKNAAKAAQIQDAESIWADLTPYLDRAMAGLKQKERDAVLLRYFEDNSVEEVAVKLSVSQEVIKKRLSSSLTKLRNFLRRKGIIVPVAMLAYLLPGKAVTAAPVGLAATTASNVFAAISVGTALSGASAVIAKRVIKMMFWAKLKTAAVITVAAVAVGGAAAPVVVEAVTGIPSIDAEKLAAALKARVSGVAAPIVVETIKDKEPPVLKAVEKIAESNEIHNQIKVAIEEKSELVDTHSQTELPAGKVPRPQGDCSISGKVVSAKTGEPVGHARVYLFYLGTHAPIFINVASDGSFIFKDIPEGPFSLRTVKTAGFQTAVYNPEGTAGQFPQFSLAEGEQRDGIILNVEPAYSIAGKVLDEGGNPLKEQTHTVLAWVETENDNDDGVMYRLTKQTKVAADGSYLLDGLDKQPVYIMAIDWQGQLKDDAYPPNYYPGTVNRNEAEIISFNKETQINGIDIQLTKKGNHELVGEVMDASTGKAVPKALVILHHRDMLFDLLTTYTDEEGCYRFEGIGLGDFLIHIDAEVWGFVRHRRPVIIEPGIKKTEASFSLMPGVTISGKFVDHEGQPMQISPRAAGWAHIVNDLIHENKSWTLTNMSSKYGPKYGAHGRTGTKSFVGGEGDYGTVSMDFPSPSTFIIKGIMPGKTIINYNPVFPDTIVSEILYNGENIIQNGIETESGQEIKDIAVVLFQVDELEPEEDSYRRKTNTEEAEVF